MGVIPFTSQLMPERTQYWRSARMFMIARRVLSIQTGESQSDGGQIAPTIYTRLQKGEPLARRRQEKLDGGSNGEPLGIDRAGGGLPQIGSRPADI
jgi:hypothetical protein